MHPDENNRGAVSCGRLSVVLDVRQLGVVQVLGFGPLSETRFIRTHLFERIGEQGPPLFPRRATLQRGEPLLENPHHFKETEHGFADDELVRAVDAMVLDICELVEQRAHEGRVGAYVNATNGVFSEHGPALLRRKPTVEFLVHVGDGDFPQLSQGGVRQGSVPDAPLHALQIGEVLPRN